MKGLRLFFRLYFRNCKSCVCNWDDILPFNSSLSSSYLWFSYILYFIIIFPDIRCGQHIFIGIHCGLLECPKLLWLAKLITLILKTVFSRTYTTLTSSWFCFIRITSGQLARIHRRQWNNISAVVSQPAKCFLCAGFKFKSLRLVRLLFIL